MVDIPKLLQKNFTKFGNIRKLCTFKSIGNSTYNPSTGVVTGVTINTDTLYIIFDEFNPTKNQSTEKKQDNENVRKVDKIAIFPALDLVFDPKENDIIVDPDLIEWRVIGETGDAATAHYSLHLQRIL